MSLNETPDQIQWSNCHFIFVEQEGPFEETAPACWKTFHKSTNAIRDEFEVICLASLYKVEPDLVYRAGAFLNEKPTNLPKELKYENFKGGLYTRFVLNGSFEQLPEACERVFDIVDEMELEVRDDFFIENYVTDPNQTPEDELITEILIPTAQ